MNKDVIYIEAEDDITDILSKVKTAKNKIVALVPPKKAGVLHSAVNFKLITKTATKANKTVVLVSADESLKRLAATANIPVAKTLQSKPQIPHHDDAVEFGEEETGNVIEAEEENSKKIEVKKEDEDSATAETEEEEQPKKKADKNTEAKTATAAAATKKAKKTEAEAEPADDVIEEEKPSRKKSNKKVPNFKKYQKFIIAGVLAVILLVGFCVWALVIAPAVKITVTATIYPNSFSEKVSFTDVEGNDDVDNGILYSESKTITKSVSKDFEATGELDKGTKASGKITLTRVTTSPVTQIVVASGTRFIHDGKTYISTSAGTLRAIESGDCNTKIIGWSVVCDSLKATISTTVDVVAAEVGEGYNINASDSGWTTNHASSGAFKISSSAMTGGTSKIVKIVSEKDIEKAESELDMGIDNEARDELSEEFSDEYILISSSFSSDNGKITTSPALNEEVGDGVTPKIIKEVKYTIFAVRRDDVERYIRKIAEANLGGDDTQMVHDTGIAGAWIDTFKDTGNGTHTGKIKTTYMTGPKITEQIVLDKVKGKKNGEVKTMIESIKGVKRVDVNPSFFWVTSVPDDANKVSIEIKSDQEK